MRTRGRFALLLTLALAASCGGRARTDKPTPIDPRELDPLTFEPPQPDAGVGPAKIARRCFEQSYPRPGDWTYGGFTALPSGGGVFAGRVVADGRDQLQLLRVDNSGQVVWDKTFLSRRFGFVQPTALAARPDGHLVVTGFALATEDDVEDVWLAEFDDAGVLVWETALLGEEAEFGKDLLVTTEGIVLLSTIELADDDRDVGISGLDSRGRVLWQREYGGRGVQDARALTRLADGYAFAATTAAKQDAQTDLWLVRTGPRGEEKAKKVLGGPDYDSVSDLVAHADGVAIAGRIGVDKAKLGAWVAVLGPTLEKVAEYPFAYATTASATALTAAPGGGWYTTIDRRADDMNVPIATLVLAGGPAGVTLDRTYGGRSASAGQTAYEVIALDGRLWLAGSRRAQKAGPAGAAHEPWLLSVDPQGDLCK